MMCYKDRLFCSAYGRHCNNASCDRALTASVKEDAERWASSFADKAPIAVSDLSMGCADIIEPVLSQ